VTGAGALDGARVDLGAADDAVGAHAHAAGGDVVAVVLAARPAEGAARHVRVTRDVRVVAVRRGAVVDVVAGVLAEVAADGAAVAGALTGLLAAVPVGAPEKAVGPAAAITELAALAAAVAPAPGAERAERDEGEERDGPRGSREGAGGGSHAGARPGGRERRRRGRGW